MSPSPPVSSHYPGLVPGMPGGLAALSLPGASRLGFPHISAGVSVLLVSNLNPEVLYKMTKLLYAIHNLSKCNGSNCRNDS